MVLAAPLVFFGIVEGVLFLTGRFEPLTALKTVAHEGREYWTTEPEYGPFALQRPDAPRPHHVWLPVDKDPNQLRVVMLGESAVAGFPSEEYSLGRLTRALWNERFPQRPMQVATVALVGVNSHALRQFALESMQLKPDVLVIYAGHNEVIGPYGPASSPLVASGSLARLSMAVRNTRTGRALESAMGKLGQILLTSSTERWSGLDEHKDSHMPADDPALEGMLENLRENLRDIVDVALANGCKVLVCIPAVNLTDWPPMASAAGQGKSAQEAYNRAVQLRLAGKTEEAWEDYRRACDLDLLRFRADSRVRQTQRDLVREISSPDVAYVDADFWLHEWNPVFTDDRSYFLEHVHLSFEGRVAVASLMVDGVAELTGEAPPLGIGRGEFADRAAWWNTFPARVQAAKDRVLFTELDEAYLWDATADLLEMNVFRGMTDQEERRKILKARVAELRDRGRARWSAAAIDAAAHRGSAMDPEDGWIDLKAAENLANLGAFQAAKKHLDSARRKYPRLVQVHTALAQKALRDRRPMDALDHLAAMDELLPESAEPIELYAVAHLVSGNPAAAIPYLEKIAASSPDKAGAWFELAKAQAAAGRLDKAIDTCYRGMEHVGEDSELQALLSRLLEKERGGR